MSLSYLETRIPPPLIAILAGFGVTALAARLPEYTFAVPHRAVLATAMAAVSLAFAVKGIYDLLHHRTTTMCFTPRNASKLVRTGVYGVSRNPMYLGLVGVLLAWSVFKGAPLGVLPFAGYVGYMNRFQIGPEEHALRKFAEYAAYCESVPRWL